MLLFTTSPLEFVSTVSFSNMSTNISFFIDFLSVSLLTGLCTAVDDTVELEKMLGLKELVYFLAVIWTGSLTTNCFSISVVMS